MFNVACYCCIQIWFCPRALLALSIWMCGTLQSICYILYVSTDKITIKIPMLSSSALTAYAHLSKIPSNLCNKKTMTKNEQNFNFIFHDGQKILNFLLLNIILVESWIFFNFKRHGQKEQNDKINKFALLLPFFSFNL